MFPPPGVPLMRAPSAAAGDFDPESPRRDSLTGEVGPAPFPTFPQPPGASQHSNPLYAPPGGPLPPSRLPPPPPRATGAAEPTAPAFLRPSGIPQPGFLSGVPLPTVPRTANWPPKVAAPAPGGISRSNSNAPTPTVLSPTQGAFVQEEPSEVIQMSEPNVGVPYVPQRHGSGSPLKMHAAAQIAAAFKPEAAVPQLQQVAETQTAYGYNYGAQQAQHEAGGGDVPAEAQTWAQPPQDQHPEHQQYQGGYEGYGAAYEGGYEGGYDPSTAAAAATAAQPPEMGGFGGGYEAYGTAPGGEAQPEMGGFGGEYEAAAAAPPELDGGYGGGDFGSAEGHDGGYGGDLPPPPHLPGLPGAAPQHDGYGTPPLGPSFGAAPPADGAGRKLPPPAASMESPIKAKYAKGAAPPGGAHAVARPGSLAGALAAVPSFASSSAPGLPRGFVGSSVASAPTLDEEGAAGEGEVDQGGWGLPGGGPAPPPTAPPTGLPPPPSLSASGFPVFPKPLVTRKDSGLSDQPGSGRSGSAGAGASAAPPPFGAPPPPMRMGSGAFMPAPVGRTASGEPGMLKPFVPGSPRAGSRPGTPRSPGASRLAPQPSSLDPKAAATAAAAAAPPAKSRQERRRRRCRGLGPCRLLFLLTLALAVGAAVSAAATVMAVTTAVGAAATAFSGIGAVARGVSLAAALRAAHPAAADVASHVDTVSRAQWESTLAAIKCDEKQVWCRGARLSLHAARMGGVLAKDGALLAIERAPEAWKTAGEPSLAFAKRQGAALAAQAAALKTPEGREAAVTALRRAATDLKVLGSDLVAWARCVTEHLSVSGVQSIEHVTQPVAGCWGEAMHRYLEPAAVEEVAAEGDGASASTFPGEEGLEDPYAAYYDDKFPTEEDTGVKDAEKAQKEPEAVPTPPTATPPAPVLEEDASREDEPAKVPPVTVSGEDPYADYPEYAENAAMAAAQAAEAAAAAEAKQQQQQKDEVAPAAAVADMEKTAEEKHVDEKSAQALEPEPAVAVPEALGALKANGTLSSEVVPPATNATEPQTAFPIANVTESQAAVPVANATESAVLAPLPTQSQEPEPAAQLAVNQTLSETSDAVPEAPEVSADAEIEPAPAAGAEEPPAAAVEVEKPVLQQEEAHEALEEPKESDLAKEEPSELYQDPYADHLAAPVPDAVAGDVGPWDSNARRVTADELLHSDHVSEPPAAEADDEVKLEAGPITEEAEEELKTAEAILRASLPHPTDEELAAENAAQQEELHEEPVAETVPEPVAAAGDEKEEEIEVPTPAVATPEPAVQETVASADVPVAEKKEEAVATAGALLARLSAALDALKAHAAGAGPQILAATEAARAFLMEHSTIVVAIAAVGATSAAFMLGSASAARTAAAAAAAGQQPVTPRARAPITPRAGEEPEGPATVFQSAKSGRTKAAAARVSVDEEEDGEEDAGAGPSVAKPAPRRGRQSAPARLARQTVDEEEEEAPAPARGRKSTRGGASGAGQSRSRSRAGTGARGGRKASVSRRTTKAAAS